MKRLCFVMPLLLTAWLSRAQVTGGEYFFDTDPGVGNGTAISLASGNSVNHSFTVPITGLTQGLHNLFIRVRNVQNVWSHTEGRLVYVLTPPSSANSEVVSGEWFIDTDPGVGNGTAISFSASQNVSSSVVVPLSSLSVGFHNLFLRVKNTEGKWSHYEGRMFYIMETPVSQNSQVVTGEWFIDTDPGLGNGTAISFTASQSVFSSIVIPVSSLSNGFHNLFLRVQNTDGTWSHYEGREFEVSENAPTCTLPPVEYDYCYGDDGDLQVLYEAYVGESMSVTITGTTETNYDYLIIYDGTSTSDPVLYNASGDHTGQTFTSTSGSLLLQITSDGITSCEAGSSCCSSGITVAVSCGDLATVTGIADAAPDEDTAMQLYPNPTNGEFTIAGTKANHTIEVYNNMGQLLLRQNAQQQRTSVNLQQQAPGIYHVHVIGDTEVTRFKLIKQ